MRDGGKLNHIYTAAGGLGHLRHHSLRKLCFCVRILCTRHLRFICKTGISVVLGVRSCIQKPRPKQTQWAKQWQNVHECTLWRCCHTTRAKLGKRHISLFDILGATYVFRSSTGKTSNSKRWIKDMPFSIGLLFFASVSFHLIQL